MAPKSGRGCFLHGPYCEQQGSVASRDSRDSESTHNTYLDSERQYCTATESLRHAFRSNGDGPTEERAVMRSDVHVTARLLRATLPSNFTSAHVYGYSSCFGGATQEG